MSDENRSVNANKIMLTFSPFGPGGPCWGLRENIRVCKLILTGNTQHLNTNVCQQTSS